MECLWVNAPSRSFLASWAVWKKHPKTLEYIPAGRFRVRCWRGGVILAHWMHRRSCPLWCLERESQTNASALSHDAATIKAVTKICKTKSTNKSPNGRDGIRAFAKFKKRATITAVTTQNSWQPWLCCMTCTSSYKYFASTFVPVLDVAVRNKCCSWSARFGPWLSHPTCTCQLDKEWCQMLDRRTSAASRSIASVTF